MGNKKAREATKQRERDLAWEKVRTEQRAATTDVSAFAIGARRLQLIVLPSFEASRAWEVRQLDQNWALYRSQVVSQHPEVVLVGYEQIPIEEKILKTFFERVSALSLPLEPDMRRVLGCDGTLTQLAIFGSLSSEWRFQWWSNPPEQWNPLTTIAAEMLAAFSAADPQTGLP